MSLTEVAHFSISHLRILDEQGQIDEELRPDLSDEQLRSLYRAMVLGRRVDERLLKLQRQGRIGTFPPTSGQEAASVGPVFAMRQDDWLVPSFRELPGQLVRGTRLRDVLLYDAGFEEGQAQGPESRNLPNAIILGSQLPHAVGLAFAMRYEGRSDSAVLAFMGDGATSEGDFHEALNFAGVWDAPVVFVCQNNGWAISLPRKRQSHSETLAQKAIAYGIHGIQVDGNDVLATYEATRQALERARAGNGATLIEAVTYRMLMHTTADDPGRYRKEQEVEAWRERDPIIRLRLYMEQRGVWDQAREDQLAAELGRQIDEEVTAFERHGELPPEEVFDHQFAEPPPSLRAQKQQFMQELRREEADG